MSIKKGDLFWVNLNPTRGSEQAGHRPVLIVQNDVGNEFAPTVIAAPLTTRKFSKEFPTNVEIPPGEAATKEQSTILLSQIRTIDKNRLEKKIGRLSSNYLTKVNRAIRISLDV